MKLTNEEIIKQANRFVDDGIKKGWDNNRILKELDTLLESGCPISGAIINYLCSDLTPEERDILNSNK